MEIPSPLAPKGPLRGGEGEVTTYLDQDILETLRMMAIDSGSKYQTVLNQLLRSYLFGKSQGLVARVERLERKIS